MGNATTTDDIFQGDEMQQPEAVVLSPSPAMKKANSGSTQDSNARSSCSTAATSSNPTVSSASTRAPALSPPSGTSAGTGCYSNKNMMMVSKQDSGSCASSCSVACFASCGAATSTPGGFLSPPGDSHRSFQGLRLQRTASGEQDDGEQDEDEITGRSTSNRRNGARFGELANNSFIREEHADLPEDHRIDDDEDEQESDVDEPRMTRAISMLDEHMTEKVIADFLTACELERKANESPVFPPTGDLPSGRDDVQNRKVITGNDTTMSCPHHSVFEDSVGKEFFNNPETGSSSFAGAAGSSSLTQSADVLSSTTSTKTKPKTTTVVRRSSGSTTLSKSSFGSSSSAADKEITSGKTTSKPSLLLGDDSTTGCRRVPRRRRTVPQAIETDLDHEEQLFVQHHSGGATTRLNSALGAAAGGGSCNTIASSHLAEPFVPIRISPGGTVQGSSCPNVRRVRFTMQQPLDIVTKSAAVARVLLEFGADVDAAVKAPLFRSTKPLFGAWVRFDTEVNNRLPPNIDLAALLLLHGADFTEMLRDVGLARKGHIKCGMDFLFEKEDFPTGPMMNNNGALQLPGITDKNHIFLRHKIAAWIKRDGPFAFELLQNLEKQLLPGGSSAIQRFSPGVSSSNSRPTSTSKSSNLFGRTSGPSGGLPSSLAASSSHSASQKEKQATAQELSNYYQQPAQQTYAIPVEDPPLAPTPGGSAGSQHAFPDANLTARILIAAQGDKNSAVDVHRIDHVLKINESNLLFTTSQRDESADTLLRRPGGPLVFAGGGTTAQFLQPRASSSSSSTTGVLPSGPGAGAASGTTPGTSTHQAGTPAPTPRTPSTLLIPGVKSRNSPENKKFFGMHLPSEVLERMQAGETWRRLDDKFYYFQPRDNVAFLTSIADYLQHQYNSPSTSVQPPDEKVEKEQALLLRELVLVLRELNALHLQRAENVRKGLLVVPMKHQVVRSTTSGSSAVNSAAGAGKMMMKKTSTSSVKGQEDESVFQVPQIQTVSPSPVEPEEEESDPSEAHAEIFVSPRQTYRRGRTASTGDATTPTTLCAGRKSQHVEEDHDATTSSASSAAAGTAKDRLNRNDVKIRKIKAVMKNRDKNFSSPRSGPKTTRQAWATKSSSTGVEVVSTASSPGQSATPSPKSMLSPGNKHNKLFKRVLASSPTGAADHITREDEFLHDEEGHTTSPTTCVLAADDQGSGSDAREEFVIEDRNCWALDGGETCADQHLRQLQEENSRFGTTTMMTSLGDAMLELDHPALDHFELENPEFCREWWNRQSSSDKPHCG
ncbi:unnamed protein product [Amoebophrya sp. A120]|nr:unnamed protein product [Amoebophrya sp. A120]|eukprot:GSA120T00023137001.1